MYDVTMVVLYFLYEDGMRDKKVRVGNVSKRLRPYIYIHTATNDLWVTNIYTHTYK